MTNDEKLAEAHMVSIDEATRAVKDATLAAGGGGYPAPNTPESWAAMVDGFQAAAMDAYLGIPLIYGVDAVHGHSNVVGATLFPHNVGLGATGNPSLVRQAAAADPVAKEVIDSLASYQAKARGWTAISDQAYLNSMPD